MIPAIPSVIVQFWGVVLVLRLVSRYWCPAPSSRSTAASILDESCAVRTQGGAEVSVAFTLFSITVDVDLARHGPFRLKGGGGGGTGGSGGSGSVLSPLSPYASLLKAWYSLGAVVMLVGNVCMPAVLLVNLWNYYLYQVTSLFRGLRKVCVRA